MNAQYIVAFDLFQNRSFQDGNLLEELPQNIWQPITLTLNYLSTSSIELTFTRI
jgi:hypothetical protein